MHKLFLLGAKMKGKALKVSVIWGRQVSALKGFKGDTASPVPPSSSDRLFPPQWPSWPITNVRDTLNPKTPSCSFISLFSRVLFPAPEGPLSTTGLGLDMVLTQDR